MSNALVPITAPTRPRPQPFPPVSAGFLAHLIATARHAPQTRMRRRAEPGEATAAYTALGHWPIPPGRAFSGSL